MSDAPTPTRTRARRRVALLATTLALAATLGVPMADAQAAPPVVTVTAADGSVVHRADCRGVASTSEDPATFVVARTGDTTAALSVDVTVTGPLAASLPDPVVIPAGSASVTLATDATAGSAELTVDAGAGYEVGSPASAEGVVATMVADLGCNIGPARTSEQTIALGARPLDIAEPTDADPAAVEAAELQIDGDVPPGLTFHADGTWTGAATELGTSRFTAYWCDDEDFCFSQLDVTIHVVQLDVREPVLPARPAPPATPIPARPAYTG